MKFKLCELLLLLLTYIWSTCCVLGLVRFVNPDSRNLILAEKFKILDGLTANCGGFQVQWQLHGGQCGTCGEQAGRSINLKQLEQFQPITLTNGILNIHIQFTPDLKGYLEIRLCKTDNYNSQECHKQRPLSIVNVKDVRYYPDVGEENAQLSVEVSKDVTCSNCILQIKYNTGYRENLPPEICNGCGPQEQFYDCALVNLLKEDIKQNGGTIQERSKRTRRQAPEKVGVLDKNMGVVFSPDTPMNSADAGSVVDIYAGSAGSSMAADGGASNMSPSVGDPGTAVSGNGLGAVVSVGLKGQSGAAADTMAAAALVGGSDAVGEVVDAAKDVVGGVTDLAADVVGGAVDAAMDSAGAAADVIGGASEAVADVTGGAVDAVKDIAGTAADAISDVSGGAVDAIKDVAGGPADVVGGAAEAVADATGGAIDAVKDIAGTAADAISDVAGGAVETIKDVAGTAADMVSDVPGGAIDAASEVIGGASEVMADMTGGAVDAVKDIAGTPADVISGAAEAVSDATGGAVDAVTDIAGTAADAISDVAGGAVDAIKDVAGTAADVVSDVSGGAIDAASEAIGGASEVVADVTGGAVDAIQDVAGTATDVVADMVSGASEVVADVAGGAVDIAGGALDAVVDVAGGSTDVVKGIVGDAMDVVGDVTGGSIDVVKEVAGSAADVITGSTADAVDTAVDMTKDVIGTATDIISDIKDGPIGEVVSGAVEVAKDVVSVAKDVVSDVKDTSVGEIVSGVIDMKKDTLSSATDIASDVLSSSVDMAKDVVGTASDVVSDVVSGSIDTATDVVSSASEVVSDVLSGTVDATKDVVGSASEVVSDVVSGTVDTTKDVVSSASEIASDVVSGTVDVTKDAVGSTSDIVSDVTSHAVDVTKEVISGISELASDVVSKSVDMAKDVVSSTSELTSEIVSNTFDKTKDIVSSTADVVTDVVDKTRDTQKDVVEGIVDGGAATAIIASSVLSGSDSGIPPPVFGRPTDTTMDMRKQSKSIVYTTANKQPMVYPAIKDVPTAVKREYTSSKSSYETNTGQVPTAFVIPIGVPLNREKQITYTTVKTKQSRSASSRSPIGNLRSDEPEFKSITTHTKTYGDTRSNTVDDSKSFASETLWSGFAPRIKAQNDFAQRANTGSSFSMPGSTGIDASSLATGSHSSQTAGGAYIEVPFVNDGIGATTTAKQSVNYQLYPKAVPNFQYFNERGRTVNGVPKSRGGLYFDLNSVLKGFAGVPKIGKPPSEFTKDKSTWGNGAFGERNSFTASVTSGKAPYAHTGDTAFSSMDFTAGVRTVTPPPMANLLSSDTPRRAEFVHVPSSRSVKRRRVNCQRGQRLVCRGVGENIAIPGIAVWCEDNCQAGVCPQTICNCNCKDRLSYNNAPESKKETQITESTVTSNSVGSDKATYGDILLEPYQPATIEQLGSKTSHSIITSTSNDKFATADFENNGRIDGIDVTIRGLSTSSTSGNLQQTGGVSMTATNDMLGRGTDTYGFDPFLANAGDPLLSTVSQFNAGDPLLASGSASDSSSRMVSTEAKSSHPSPAIFGTSDQSMNQVRRAAYSSTPGVKGLPIQVGFGDLGINPTLAEFTRVDGDGSGIQGQYLRQGPINKHLLNAVGNSSVSSRFVTRTIEIPVKHDFSIATPAVFKVITRTTEERSLPSHKIHTLNGVVDTLENHLQNGQSTTSSFSKSSKDAIQASGDMLGIAVDHLMRANEQGKDTSNVGRQSGAMISADNFSSSFESSGNLGLASGTIPPQTNLHRTTKTTIYTTKTTSSQGSTADTKYDIGRGALADSGSISGLRSTHSISSSESGPRLVSSTTGSSSSEATESTLRGQFSHGASGSTSDQSSSTGKTIHLDSTSTSSHTSGTSQAGNSIRSSTGLIGGTGLGSIESVSTTGSSSFGGSSPIVSGANAASMESGSTVETSSFSGNSGILSGANTGSVQSGSTVETSSFGGISNIVSGANAGSMESASTVETASIRGNSDIRRSANTGSVESGSTSSFGGISDIVSGANTGSMESVSTIETSSFGGNSGILSGTDTGSVDSMSTVDHGSFGGNSDITNGLTGTSTKSVTFTKSSSGSSASTIGDGTSLSYKVAIGDGFAGSAASQDSSSGTLTDTLSFVGSTDFNANRGETGSVRKLAVVGVAGETKETFYNIACPSPLFMSCRGSGLFFPVPGMDVWCIDRCTADTCPRDKCACTCSEEKPIPIPLPDPAPAPYENVNNRVESTSNSVVISTDGNKQETYTDIFICEGSQVVICESIGSVARTPGGDWWCVALCTSGPCPNSKCRCRCGSKTERGLDTGSQSASLTSFETSVLRPIPDTSVSNSFSHSSSSVETSSNQGLQTNPDSSKAISYIDGSMSTGLDTSSAFARSGSRTVLDTSQPRTSDSQSSVMKTVSTSTTSAGTIGTSTGAFSSTGTVGTSTGTVASSIGTLSDIKCLEGQVISCVSIGEYTGMAGVSWWCEEQCSSGPCPADQCKCSCVQRASAATQQDQSASSSMTRTSTVTRTSDVKGPTIIEGIQTPQTGGSSYTVRTETITRQSADPPRIIPVSWEMTYRLNCASNEDLICDSVGEFYGVPGMSWWCVDQCRLGPCPEQLCHCKCDIQARAASVMNSRRQMDLTALEVGSVDSGSSDTTLIGNMGNPDSAHTTLVGNMGSASADTTMVDSMSSGSTETTMIDSMATGSTDTSMVDSMATGSIETSMMDSMSSGSTETSMVDSMTTGSTETSMVDSMTSGSTDTTMIGNVGTASTEASIGSTSSDFSSVTTDTTSQTGSVMDTRGGAIVDQSLTTDQSSIDTSMTQTDVSTETVSGTTDMIGTDLGTSTDIITDLSTSGSTVAENVGHSTMESTMTHETSSTTSEGTTGLVADTTMGGSPDLAISGTVTETSSVSGMETPVPTADISGTDILTTDTSMTSSTAESSSVTTDTGAVAPAPINTGLGTFESTFTHESTETTHTSDAGYVQPVDQGVAVLDTSGTSTQEFASSSSTHDSTSSTQTDMVGTEGTVVSDTGTTAGETITGGTGVFQTSSTITSSETSLQDQPPPIIPQIDAAGHVIEIIRTVETTSTDGAQPVEAGSILIQQANDTNVQTSVETAPPAIDLSVGGFESTRTETSVQTNNEVVPTVIETGTRGIDTTQSEVTSIVTEETQPPPKIVPSGFIETTIETTVTEDAGKPSTGVVLDTSQRQQTLATSSVSERTSTSSSTPKVPAPIVDSGAVISISTSTSTKSETGTVPVPSTSVATAKETASTTVEKKTSEETAPSVPVGGGFIHVTKKVVTSETPAKVTGPVVRTGQVSAAEQVKTESEASTVPIVSGENFKATSTKTTTQTGRSGVAAVPAGAGAVRIVRTQTVSDQGASGVGGLRGKFASGTQRTTSTNTVPVASGPRRFKITKIRRIIPGGVALSSSQQARVLTGTTQSQPGRIVLRRQWREPATLAGTTGAQGGRTVTTVTRTAGQPTSQGALSTRSSSSVIGTGGTTNRAGTLNMPVAGGLTGRGIASSTFRSTSSLGNSGATGGLVNIPTTGGTLGATGSRRTSTFRSSSGIPSGASLGATGTRRSSTFSSSASGRPLLGGSVGISGGRRSSFRTSSTTGTGGRTIGRNTAGTGRRLKCVGVGDFQNVTNVGMWCETNCSIGVCPQSVCRCTSS